MNEHEEFCKAADEKVAKAEAENARLRAEVERWKAMHSAASDKEHLAVLQIDVLQKRMEAIAKVASKPGSLFPKGMAEMTKIEQKIALVACELSGDLSYIKSLAESPITEKRNDKGSTVCPHCGALFGCDGKTCYRR